jgi:hypothetical protein
VFSRGGDRETLNHETEDEPTKIRGGNAAEAVSSHFSNLSNITNIATMMKRE